MKNQFLITLFLFFLLVVSSTARYLPADVFYFDNEGRFRIRMPEPDESEICYFSFFKGQMEYYQRKADVKYPVWKYLDTSLFLLDKADPVWKSTNYLDTSLVWKSTNYLDRSLFLLEKAQNFVQLWDRWRKRQNRGNPYDDLRNKVQGDLWPIHYDYCRQSEGTNLLSYMMYDFCRQSETTNLLKYVTYGLSPEADIV